jgi:hypothetical protein
MHNPFLVWALRKCATGEEVEVVFNKFRKMDYQTRMDYLKVCQGNPQVFFSGGEGEDKEKELYSNYLTMRSMFVTGSWR